MCFRNHFSLSVMASDINTIPLPKLDLFGLFPMRYFCIFFFFFFFCDLSGFSRENEMSRRTLKHFKLLLSGCWVTVNLTGSKFSIADQ